MRLIVIDDMRANFGLAKELASDLSIELDRTVEELFWIGPNPVARWLKSSNINSHDELESHLIEKKHETIYLIDIHMPIEFPWENEKNKTGIDLFYILLKNNIPYSFLFTQLFFHEEENTLLRNITEDLKITIKKRWLNKSDINAFMLKKKS